MCETCFRDRGIDLAVYETRFRDRGIVCVWSLCSSLSSFGSNTVGRFRYKVGGLGWLSVSPLPSLPYYSLLPIMSSPSSSYVQVGLDNLERPLNRSPSPRAQVRGFDWSLVLVD